MVCDCRHVRRSGARRVGCCGAGDAARSAAVLRRILEARWPVRRLGGGLPAVVHQSECAAQARRARHAAAVGSRGHQRYAHITALRCDPVNPPLLGMRKVVSEDAVRRGLAKIDETAGMDWLQAHLDYCVSPLLQDLGFSMSTRRSSRCTARRKAPSWATTRTSRVDRRIAITRT